MRQATTAKEYATAAGVTTARIRQLLISGQLDGYKRAGSWFISNNYKAKLYLQERKEKPGGNGGNGS